MRIIIIVLLLALTATPAVATNICDELWWTRNAVMDRAGYCFDTPLGAAVFDNGDCEFLEVDLDAESRSFVQQIRAYEEAEGCAVDTTRTRLEITDLDYRRRMVGLPVRTPYESACIGWRLAEAPLLDNHAPGARIVGSVRVGDTINLWHEPVGAWRYVTITNADGALVGAGWMREELDEASCKAWAG